MTVDEQWNQWMLRDLCDHMTPRAMMEVIAQACDDVVSANPGKPVSTYASINGNLIRLALSRMVEAPVTGKPISVDLVPLTRAEEPRA